jgi:hypothetical protein
MAASTIHDEDEVIRWFSEDRTYAWMSEEYERRYNITASASLWADFRRRKGLSRRVVPDTVRLAGWRRELAGCGLVVHDDADTEQGFCDVPRCPGLDLDLIREP